MSSKNKIALIAVTALSLSIAGWQDLFAQTNKPGTATKVQSTTVTVYKPGAYASGIPVNYVRTWQPKLPYTSEANVKADIRTVDEVNHATEYIDGLGRPLQTVSWQTSPGKKDLVAPQVYDSIGREQYQFLPYTDSLSDGQFKNDPFDKQSDFYSNVYPGQQPAFNNEQIFYSKAVMERSAQSRMLKSFAPGNSWAGSEGGSAEHAVQMQYLVNEAADSVVVWNIANDTIVCHTSDTSINIPSTSSFYDAGELFKNVTTDERGNQVIEYKDKEGHVILKKVQIGSVSNGSAYTNWLCTYYVYDDFGLLRFVIPPKATALLLTNSFTLTGTIINELCFRYEYDNRNRMIAKKVPGAGWVYMVYDKRDRLVFTQDANMRLNNQWLYMLYDDINRPLQTGMMIDNISVCDLQHYVDSITGNNIISTDTSSGNNITGIPANLTFNSPQQGSTYQATDTIRFAGGYSNTGTSGFVAQIVSGSSPTFNSATVVLDNPIPSGATAIPLTLTYYDDYSQTIKVYDNSNNSKLDIGTNPYGEMLPSTATTLTTGMATVARVRVIENPSDLTQGSWLETATFYDQKGRPIQTNGDNYKGGQDIGTSRYDFTNKVICSYMVHNNPAAGITDLRIKTNMNYDHAERLISVTKEINDDASTLRLITRNTYDALGQLLNKELGQKNATDTSAMENQTYNYNIRGWLKGINWDYSDNADGTKPLAAASGGINGNNWFSMDLSYDWGFDSSQFNGNITGQRWQSGGDGQERAFGYGYDAASRLLFADFNQNNDPGSTPAWNKNLTASSGSGNIDFSLRMGDGANPFSAYDENGNILQLTQKGLLLNTSSVIDSLSYAYYTGTNKLQNVLDEANDVNTKLGDFRSSTTYMAALGGTKTTSATDYTYDDNGNLQKDLNKDIGTSETNGVVYNHLNLPYQITVQGKGTITYIYDAAGNKLEKRTVETAISKTTTTDYIGGFEYINDTLQFFAHEEGRVRPSSVDGSPWSFDYFIKDHLGDIRMVLTEQQKQDVYPAATLEDGSLTLDTSYYTINPSNIVDNTSITGFTSDDNYENKNGIANPDPGITATATSAKMYKLNGSSGDKTGLGITLRVMAGDTVSIFGKSYWYDGGGTIDNSNSITDALASFIDAFAGTRAITGVEAVSSSFLNSSTSFTAPLTDLLNGVTTPTTNTPKAYINWILFDEHFVPVASSSGFDGVGDAGSVIAHYKTVNILKNGYLYVYCSNESNIDVFFDNLQVVQAHGPLVQDNAYSPWGLQLQGISGNAVCFGKAETQKHLYNGKEMQDKEFSDGNGLEEYDFEARMQDPQIGRWNTIDPMAGMYKDISPYVFVKNNPENNIEIDGRYFDEKNEKKAEKIDKKLDKKINKLDKQIARLEKKGKDIGDRQERVTELSKSKTDITSMRNDASTEYVYGSAMDKNNKAGIGHPNTAATDENKKGDLVVTMFAENNMGSILHEGRHGGQNARGEYSVLTGANYGVSDEISAYKAEYSWDGILQYRSSAAVSNEVALERYKNGQDPTVETITQIQQITSSVVLSMVDLGYKPIYPPAGMPVEKFLSH